MSSQSNGEYREPATQAAELINQAFGLVIAMTSLRVVFEMGLEQHVPAGGTATTEDLSKSTGADAQFIIRAMRPLLPLCIFEEVAPGAYRQTPLSMAFRDPKLRGYMQVGWDMWLPVYGSLHTWFKASKFQLSQDAASTPFSAVHGDALFDHLGKNPAAAAVFNASMEHLAYPVGKLFPWNDRFSGGTVIEGCKHNVIVDVGGGKGQASREILAELPRLRTHIVLQDQADVLKKVPEDLKDRVQTMPYDFFTKQPLQGAAFYYLRNILCDWPDEKCIEILRNQASAMAPASRLLIATRIMPEERADSMTAAMDICMLTYGGAERTLTQYKELSAQAGLVVEKVWRAEGLPWGIIETKLAN